jgi:hypothetical protein
MKISLKQKQIIRCSLKNEIVDCLKSVFPQEKKVRLGLLHFWSFSVAVPVKFLQFLHFTLVVVNGPVGV